MSNFYIVLSLLIKYCYLLNNQDCNISICIIIIIIMLTVMFVNFISLQLVRDLMWQICLISLIMPRYVTQRRHVVVW